MARRKKEAVHVPANLAEATTMIAEFVALERKDAITRIAAEAAIDKVKAQRDAGLAEIKAEMEPLFSGLKAWWEAGGKDEVAKGKRSAEIANAKIGVRLSTPKLVTERKVTFVTALEWLRKLRWTRKKEFLRTKYELDKEAIGKAIRAEPKVAEKFAGQLRVDQADEFFIDTGLDQDALKKELAG